MEYLVVDAGYLLGKDKNKIFATNDKSEAIKAAAEAGSGVVVLSYNHKIKSREIIYVVLHKTDAGFSE
jgi:hypothetical protein